MNIIYKAAIVLMCFALAGPELGIGIELILLIDAFGIELLLLSLTASMWNYWYYIRGLIERIDPYFFLSPLRDIRKCPGLIAHAIPGYMGILMIFLGLTVIAP